jgi:hypothetical protein
VPIPLLNVAPSDSLAYLPMDILVVPPPPLLQLLPATALSAFGHFSVLPSLLLSKEDPCVSWPVSTGLL